MAPPSPTPCWRCRQRTRRSRCAPESSGVAVTATQARGCRGYAFWLGLWRLRLTAAWQGGQPAATSEAECQTGAVCLSMLTGPACLPALPCLQRQALLDAAKLAGLNVMGLIHNHAGTPRQPQAPARLCRPCPAPRTSPARPEGCRRRCHPYCAHHDSCLAHPHRAGATCLALSFRRTPPAAAAALQYGIERDFTNRTETVVLYDLGAASLQAALVTYSAYTNAKVGGDAAAGPSVPVRLWCARQHSW